MTTGTSFVRLGAAMGCLASCALATPARSQAETVRLFQANYAELAGCASTALGKLYPLRVGAIKRPDVRLDRVDLIVTEPRSGFLGAVYRAHARRLTVGVAKAGERQARIEIKPEDETAVGSDEIARVWAVITPCQRGGPPRGRR